MDILKNASKVVGPEMAQEWFNSGPLGNMADHSSPLSTDFLTSNYTQNLIFEDMKVVVTICLKMWYI
jgi:hypothetical protein